jgi:SpoVK/Ycf46/Vps4 family AAA+-type ATPase
MVSLPDETQPFPDGAAQLLAEVRRVALRLERYLHLYRYRIDPDKKDALDGKSAARAAILAEEIAQHDALCAARTRVSDGNQLPLEQLRQRFHLSPAASALLVAAAAPALDVDVARAFAKAGETGQPDVALLIDLLADDPGESKRFLDELDSTAPLIRWRLVRLGPARNWSPEGPLLYRPVAVPARIVDWLQGRMEFDPYTVDRVARLRRTDEERPVDPALSTTLERALYRERDGRKLPLVVAGPALSGKATAVAAAARARGHGLLEVDVEPLALQAKPGDLLRDLLREARLQNALLLFRHGESLPENNPELRHALYSTLSDGATWVALSTRGEVPEIMRRIPGAQLARVDLPSRADQLRLWEDALPPAVARDADVDLPSLVGRYRLTPGDILAAGAAAAGNAQARGAESPVTSDDVVAAVRGRLRHRLGDVADLVVTTLGWDDLVLREDAYDRVHELLAMVRHHATVMEEWGFARKIAYGRSVSALFAGPPGTGKTMVATLIAKELGLELFRVDLSRVVSKWVGETEKNLGRAFDEAENSQAVLLFDEADSLFAKRTEVKSSNDRYANLEVNYLLQRLESFSGIVLLTTNNASAIDEAFRRRLRFRIEFPTPDEDERERLWRAMIPTGAPIDDDVDFPSLARRFAMAGGYIKNAVMRAAYLAAARTDGERRLDNEILSRAANLEWEDMGNLSRA